MAAKKKNSGNGKPKKKKPAKEPRARNRRSKYSEQEKLLYAIAFLTYGNFNAASEYTGIPATTAKAWKDSDPGAWDRLIMKAGLAREKFTSSEEASAAFARIGEMIEGMVIKGGEGATRVIDGILNKRRMSDRDRDLILRAFGIAFDKWAVVTGVDKRGIEDETNPYKRFQDRLADRMADIAGDDTSVRKTGNGKINLNATVEFEPVPPTSKN